MTPQINRLEKMSTVLRVSTDIYGVSKEIEGKMLTPSNQSSQKNKHYSESFNSHLWGF